MSDRPDALIWAMPPRTSAGDGIGQVTGPIEVADPTVTASALATLAALTAILTIWLINGVVWFARLHYRLLKPALEPTPADAGATNSTSGVSA
jgi:hypothetical protein